VQTLKAGGGVAAGLHSRHEWESRLDSPEPDLDALRAQIDRKSAWRGILHAAQLRQRLQPVFTTQVSRTVWELRLPQGDEVEFVLDQGDIRSGDKQVAVSEIEMELKSGNALHLFDFALALLQDIPLQVGNVSKAERGYALFAPAPPSAVKASALKLSRRMTVEQVFQAIAANCLAQIQANEAGLVQAQDVESLHQMRVGLRRLRSAFGQFKDLLPLPAHLQEEIDWLGEQLGPARDWDVLAGATLPKLAAALQDQAAYAALQQAARRKTDDMHAIAAAAVTSPRYARLVLSLTRWLQGRGWREGMAAAECRRIDAAVPELARGLLAAGQRRLLKRGKKLRGAGPEARHRVRIAAKKSRYATEFFQSLYPGKKVRPYIKALATLQDELGWRNDAAVAERLLRQLPEGQAHLDTPVAFLRGYLASRIDGDDRKLRKLWKKFVQTRLAI
jgi:inorganic triphosphatase YgiF